MVLALEIKIEGDLGFVEKEISDFIEAIVNQIPIEANKLFDKPKTGRLYRVGSITTRRTKGLARAGLRGKAGTKGRLISGSKIHRASAKGEPPARRTGRLGRQIKVLRRSALSWRVSFNAPYAGHLEFSLDRPFTKESVENAVKTVVGNQ